MKVRSVTTINLTEKEASYRAGEAEKASQQVADLMRARDMLAAQLEEAAARLAEAARVRDEHEQVAADMFEWADQARVDSGLPPREVPADGDQRVAVGDPDTKAHPVTADPLGVPRLRTLAGRIVRVHWVDGGGVTGTLDRVVADEAGELMAVVVDQGASVLTIDPAEIAAIEDADPPAYPAGPALSATVTRVDVQDDQHKGDNQ
jgi:hypothetical protein